MTQLCRLPALALSLTLFAGCGDDGAADYEATGANASDLDPQVPPDDVGELSRWLEAFEQQGWEDEWVCEAEASAKTDGTPAIHAHALNRVCNNQRLSTAELASGDQLPVGAAALKFVSAGTYVEVKVEPDSADGAGWFWRSPDGSIAERGAAGCTGCHSAAGSDAEHPGLGDFVYFQVLERIARRE